MFNSAVKSAATAFALTVFSLTHFGQGAALPGSDDRSTVNPPNLQLRVHKVGEVNLTITNYGILGTEGWDNLPDPETGQPAPSCEYPVGSDLEYLFAGALWVGAIVGGDTLVSTGYDGWQYVKEMFPSDLPDAEILKRSSIPTDPAYDPAAISEADYIAIYYDTLTDPGWVTPCPDDGRPHLPLGLMFRQESYSWSLAEYEDFVILRYVLTNIGGNLLDNPFVGFYFDADIHHVTTSAGFLDDISGSYRLVDPVSGDSLPVAWSADNDGDPMAGTWDFRSPLGVLGVCLLDYPLTPSFSFNWWVPHGNPSLDWGPRLTANDYDFGTGGLGTPAGDRSKYYVMATPESDYDQLWAAVDMTAEGWLPPHPYLDVNIANGYDTRFLYSFGSVDLEPGDSLEFAIAIVMGDNFHQNPNDFADLFDAANPQAFHDALDFNDLTTNVLAAIDLYRYLDIVAGQASMPDTLHLFCANALESIPAVIFAGNLAEDHTVLDVDLSSVLINGTFAPLSTTIMPGYPGFEGEVLRVIFDARDFVAAYGVVWDTTSQIFTVSGRFNDSGSFRAADQFTLIGHRSGDANGDRVVNVSDVVYLLGFIFSGLAAPNPLALGDPDCSGVVNVSDVVYLISYIFAAGPEPCRRR